MIFLLQMKFKSFNTNIKQVLIGLVTFIDEQIVDK